MNAPLSTLYENNVVLTGLETFNPVPFWVVVIMMLSVIIMAKNKANRKKLKLRRKRKKPGRKRSAIQTGYPSKPLESSPKKLKRNESYTGTGSESINNAITELTASSHYGSKRRWFTIYRGKVILVKQDGKNIVMVTTGSVVYNLGFLHKEMGIQSILNHLRSAGAATDEKEPKITFSVGR